MALTADMLPEWQMKEMLASQEDEIARLKDKVERLNISTVDLAAMKKVLDECDTLRAENEKLRGALEWALDNAGTEHPHYPYREGDRWMFPYLVSNAGGFGGGVGNAYYPTALEAVQAALTAAPAAPEQEKQNG